MMVVDIIRETLECQCQWRQEWRGTSVIDNNPRERLCVNYVESSAWNSMDRGREKAVR